MKIAIIGAGLSGCNAYNILSKSQNIQVTIFDKSRGTGGRLSCKYINDKYIDHATPFIQSNHSVLIDFLHQKTKEKILVHKNGLYLPTHGMNKLCSSLINKKDLITNCKIVKLNYANKQWSIEDDEHRVYSNYDFVIVTIPTKQILELDISINNTIKEQLKKVSYFSIASLICYCHKNQKLLSRFLYRK